jgi:hypothetical protein
LKETLEDLDPFYILDLTLYREIKYYLNDTRLDELGKYLKWDLPSETIKAIIPDTVKSFRPIDELQWSNKIKKVKRDLYPLIRQDITENLCSKISQDIKNRLLSEISKHIQERKDDIFRIEINFSSLFKINYGLSLKEEKLDKHIKFYMSTKINLDAQDIRIKKLVPEFALVTVGSLDVKIKLQYPEVRIEHTLRELKINFDSDIRIKRADQESEYPQVKRDSKGYWEPIKYKFRHLPVNMALLHTGKVLSFGGSCNDERHLANPNPAEIFDPDDDGRVFEISQKIESDLFGAGLAFLSDGSILVCGGTHKYDGLLLGVPFPPFRGSERSYIFDPIDLKWKTVQNMRYGRWCPACITLANGSVVVMSGLTKHFPWAFLDKFEIYSKKNGWQKLLGGERWLPLFPRLHLLPSGDIFYTGSFNTHYKFPFHVRAFPSAIFSVENNTWSTIEPAGNPKREEGTSVLLPLLPPDYTARVLLIGGGNPYGVNTVNDVELVDFSDKPPRYKHLAPMSHARYSCYAVLLPDQNILVLGGRKGNKPRDVYSVKAAERTSSEDQYYEDEEEYGDIPRDPSGVLEPELYNIKDNRWYPMAPMRVERIYRSNALLLPDGRVMTAGSNPGRRINELRIELFCPPYLYRGERPEISEYPPNISYGQEFMIETKDANDIIAVALMRPTATTHGTNSEQRYVGLEFVRENSSLLARVPMNRNILPPGYYLLFILKNADIPSKGKFTLLS